VKKADILIADDHELVRRGLCAVVTEVPGWRVVAEAADGRSALELALRHRPDVAVLDLAMPEQNGLEATRRIVAQAGSTRVLILTAHESEQVVREVLDAGALGYLLKSDAGHELVAAIESLLDGKPYFTSKVARLVLKGYLAAGAAAVPAASGILSPREREVVQLLAEGKSNKEVARRLGITVKTAETHRNNIMRKMHFSSLAEMVRYAVRNHIVDA
jgi:DNA-binding NarL/FixJ family response regulator